MRSVVRLTAAGGMALSFGALANASGWALEATSDLMLRAAQPEEIDAGDDGATPLGAGSLADWEAAIEVAWWYPGLFGDIRIAGSTSTAELEDIRIDEPQSAPFVEAMLRDGPYTARLSGFFFSQSADSEVGRPFTIGGLSFGSGDVVSASVDFASFQATWGYTLWEQEIVDDGRPRVTMRLDGYAGARAYDFDFAASPPGAGGVRDDATWMDLIAGLRLEVEITREFSFDVAADIGGFAWDDATSGSANIVTGFQWRPHPNLGAQIGYRFLATSYDDGDDGAQAFELNSSIAGLYGSLVLRF